jgi:lipoprotein NlpD
MDKSSLVRWVVYGMLLGMLAGCGRMLPMGGGSELIKYRVSKGETLYSISWRYGYDHREVAAWNNIKPPYEIYPGQQLLIIAPYQRHAKARRNTPVTSTSNDTRPGKPLTKPAVVARSTPPRPQAAEKGRRVEKTSNRHKKKVIAWRWPTNGVIVSGFRPSKGKKGLDIRGKIGQRIYAAADGNVVYSGSGLIGYGNLIIIKHDDTYLSAYGHNRRLLVKEGAKVKQGQKIAEMGDSGKEGVILHFEIRRDGKPVNPVAYLPKKRD